LSATPYYTKAEIADQDLKRRREAQARRPLIAQWAPNIPTGYIHVDDAIEYMHRRWGPMITAEMLENFSRDETGPQYTIFGDWPDKSRGERFYAFDAVDMWVYRTVTGVPASWKAVLGRRSTVPENRELTDGTGHREQEGDGRTRIEEDGRRRN
jgi:hypothetical protein